MAKAKKEVVQLSMNDQLQTEMAEHSLSGMWDYAENYADMEVQTVSTGFPQLDKVSHPELLGIPRRRHIEIFSKDGSSGKSTIAFQILAAFQQSKLRVAAAEPESTMTGPYFKTLGVVTDPKQDPGVCALRLLRSKIKDLNSYESTMLAAEDYLDQIKSASEVFDLVVVDSMDALQRKADQLKNASQNKQTGGISKLMSEYFRSNITKRASVIWVNQTRMSMDKPMPGMGPKYVTSGGRALAFYATQRWQLTPVGKLNDSEGQPPWGYTVQFFTLKNKIAPQWRTCKLNYIFGEGFSKVYDYFDLAMQFDIIKKKPKSSWLAYGEGTTQEVKIQGVKNMYLKLKAEPDFYKEVKTLLDGEDVSDAIGYQEPGADSPSEE